MVLYATASSNKEWLRQLCTAESSVSKFQKLEVKRKRKPKKSINRFYLNGGGKQNPIGT